MKGARGRKKQDLDMGRGEVGDTWSKREKDRSDQLPYQGQSDELYILLYYTDAAFLTALRGILQNWLLFLTDCSYLMFFTNVRLSLSCFDIHIQLKNPNSVMHVYFAHINLT